MDWRHAVGLGVAAFAFASATGAAADQAGAAEATRCVERAILAVQQRYEGVRDVSARFVQQTRPVSLGRGPSETRESRGEMVLAKPGRMRWSYDAPEPSLLVSDGETLWLYDPVLEEAQKLPATGGFLHGGGAAARFLLGAGDMRRDFEVQARSCSEDAAELELKPRDPASYEKIFLQLDPRSGDLQGTRVVDLLGNVSALRFEAMRFDTNPPPETFRFVAPEGVSVIELTP